MWSSPAGVAPAAWRIKWRPPRPATVGSSPVWVHLLIVAQKDFCDATLSRVTLGFSLTRTPILHDSLLEWKVLVILNLLNWIYQHIVPFLVELFLLNSAWDQVSLIRKMIIRNQVCVLRGDQSGQHALKTALKCWFTDSLHGKTYFTHKAELF